MGKRRYITFKVDEEIEEAAAFLPHRPASEPLSEQCGRCIRFAGFFIVCSSTVFQALAPWMLPIIEVAALLLLFLLLLWPQQPPGAYHFSFSSSTEDLLLLGGCRAVALCSTYAYGSSKFQLRPYLYTSYFVGAAGMVYALAKSYCFQYPTKWLPSAGMLLMFTVFSWLHILAARQTVVWARRQGLLGLAPVAGGPGTWAAASGSDEASGPLAGSDVDVPPEALADPDSHFVTVAGIVVHYKEALPAAPDAVHSPATHSIMPQSMSRGITVRGSPQSDEPQTTQKSTQQQQQQDSPGAIQAGAGAWMPEVSAAVQVLPTAAAAAAPRATLQHTGGSIVAYDSEAAVVLIHGFGGGTFAWRHILQPLASAAETRVVAFDRPGFGLTSRPVDSQARPSPPSSPPPGISQCDSMKHSSHGSHSTSQQQLQHSQPLLDTQLQQQQQQQQSSAIVLSPYTREAQAHLTLRFCAALGLKKVVLVGHADGCLVAAHAAAAAAASSARHREQLQQNMHSSRERTAGLDPVEVAIPVEVDASEDLNWSQATAQDLQQQQQQQQVANVSPVGIVPAAHQERHHNPTSLDDVKSIGASDAASYTSSISFQSMLLNGSNSRPQLSEGTGSQACLLCLEEGTDSSVAAAAASGVDLDQRSTTSCTAAEQQQQQQQQHGFNLGSPTPQGTSGAPFTPTSCLANSSSGSSSQQAAASAAASLAARGAGVQVCGVALLHPTLSGHQVPPFMRLLAGTSLGRSMLRPLLRSEVGEVTNRRAWHNPDLVTREVLALYRRPMRVQGWDTALLAASRAAGSISKSHVAAQLAAVRHMPALIVTGAQDRIATPAKVSAVATLLGQSQIAAVPACGHLSHEEAPQQLLQLLVPFCRDRLA